MEVKFKNRYSGKIIDMNTYIEMSINAQWDYDIVPIDSWDYDKITTDTNDEESLSGAETPNRD